MPISIEKTQQAEHVKEGFVKVTPRQSREGRREVTTVRKRHSTFWAER